ncbi:ABC transporter ATP-binding protein [Corynebacterium sp. CCM 8862]|uniref:ABC transporter ATP-binding protein n=2 Tax=Corynebacterium mendelii TaxID=2765362 RepID=A0A939E3W2_9CORY|nr:ABC transporter ATP-binding protein [Corynebacterium mendelii]
MLGRVLSGHKTALAVALVLSLVAAGLSLAQPIVVRRIVDGFSGGAPTHTLVWLLVVLVLAAGVVNAGKTYLLTVTGEKAVAGVRRDSIHRMLQLPVAFYDRTRTGDVISRVTADTTLIAQSLNGGMVQAVAGVVTFAGATVVMALIDPLMLGVVLAVVAVAVGLVVYSSRAIQQATTRSRVAVGELGANLDRTLGAYRTVLATGSGKRVEEDLNTTITEAFNQGRTIARISALLRPVSSLAMQVAFLTVLGFGGMRVAAGKMSVGDLVSFVLLLFMVAMPLGQMVTAVITIRQSLAALERIGEITNEPTEKELDAADQRHPGQPAAHPSHSKDPAAVSSAPPRITLDNVSFSYTVADTTAPDGEEDSGTSGAARRVAVIDRVSIDMPAGTTTALVGPSGAGKSTVLSLLEKFYTPDEGEILFAGEPIDHVSRSAHRQRISWVGQDAPVIAGTVRDNLHLADPDADDRRCREVLDKVNLFHRFASTGGLDTVLGDRGISLSGGERQRLALARALLLPKPVLLLDEPTSAVDTDNEQLIQAAIAESARGATVVIVAHRLATVTGADQIVVMDRGRVRARGTHRELMESSTLYHRLADGQMIT